MKKLLLLSLLISASLYGQNTATAVIYRTRIFIDRQLTNKVTVTTNGNANHLSGSMFRMPLNYIDSIKKIIEEGVGKELYAVVDCQYLIKKNGKQKSTYNSGQYVGGLPKACKKRRFFPSKKKIMCI